MGGEAWAGGVDGREGAAGDTAMGVGGGGAEEGAGTTTGTGGTMKVTEGADKGRPEATRTTTAITGN